MRCITTGQSAGYDDIEDAVDVLSLYFSLGSMQLGRVSGHLPACGSTSSSADTSHGDQPTGSLDRAHVGSAESDPRRSRRYGPTVQAERGSRPICYCCIGNRSLIHGMPEHQSPHGKKHQQFYPTRLATSLCSGGAGASSGAGASAGTGAADKGFLILETNYKIYAYTCGCPMRYRLCKSVLMLERIANELEIAILNLFIDILIRYPNLIVGKLERLNVKRAMEEGITADQVGPIMRVLCKGHR